MEEAIGGDLHACSVAAFAEQVMPLQNLVQQNAVDEPAKPDAQHQTWPENRWPGPYRGTGAVPDAVTAWQRSPPAVRASRSPARGRHTLTRSGMIHIDGRTLSNDTSR